MDVLEATEKGVSPLTVLAYGRKEVKDKKQQTMMRAVFSENGPFDVVVMDPPWPMQKIDRDDYPEQDAFDYDTMSLEEIEAFFPSKIEPKLNPDCHLFLWTTQKYLPTAFTLVERWGFRYTFLMVWHKNGGFQPHGLPQYNCEFALYARRGTPVFTTTKNFRVCNSWPRREHSRKPAEFYQLLARVTGGSRIDVFAREKHPGFAQFGKESGKFKSKGRQNGGRLREQPSVGR